MPHLRSRPDLLVAFRSGDRSALEEVYWAYVERVVRLARRFLPPTDVADVVQDVFLRAFDAKNRLAYDGLRDYGPYLLSIARNLVVDRARRAGREVSDADVAESLAAPEAEPEPAWADPATVSLVEEYLASLPDDLRRTHDVRYVRGLPQRAAAEALGISRQQLRTREARLRDGLRDLLAKRETR